MAILVKTGEGNIYLIGEYLLFDTIHLPWFFINAILIPLNIYRGINCLPLFMIWILVHNDDNLDILWTRQNTNCSNGEWINIMIINYYNVYMLVWVRMEYSDIPTSYPYISTPVNQLLTMCAVVGEHIYKFIVNLKIQFSTNSNLLRPLCIIWIGARYYLSYICRRNFPV